MKGSGELLERALSVKLGLSFAELDDLKSRLLAVNLIDENFCPISWDDRQFRSDSSKERVAKYRAKLKPKNNVTEKKRYKPVTVTAQDTDTDTDTDTEKKKIKEIYQRVAALGVDRQLWNEFLKTRVKLKANNTARALATLASRAEEYAQNGEDVKTLFEEANSNGWKTIYERKNRQQRRHSATKIATSTDW
jgi:uncharacterized protein (UPF0335 family)